jgi:hypothetical protein
MCQTSDLLLLHVDLENSNFRTAEKNSLIVQIHNPAFWHPVTAVNLTYFMNNLATVLKDQDL